jgi:predicted nucleic acid-binding protein
MSISNHRAASGSINAARESHRLGRTSRGQGRPPRGYDLKLPIADSVTVATAHIHHATLYTMDEHFKDTIGVECFPLKMSRSVLLPV